MQRILVIITNPQQASFRLRIEPLRAPLAQHGFELDVRVRPRGWTARRELLRTAGRYHAVILQRKLLDPSDALLLRRHARRILYDVDDAVMFHAHRVGRFSQWRTHRRFEATAKILDHVVAGNAYLANMFRQRGRSVTVLPTTVDLSHYRVKEHDGGEKVALVWIGSDSTLPYLQQCVPAIAEASRRSPGLRLITIANQTISHPDIRLEHIPWSLEGEADALLRGDVGIAPTPCDRWTMGKCGFKIIQYMAAGLAVIASPVGANGEIVRAGETGLVADTSEQWVAAIVQLVNDPELRRRMGRAGRERAEREYSITRAAQTWAQLLAE